MQHRPRADPLRPVNSVSLYPLLLVDVLRLLPAPDARGERRALTDLLTAAEKQRAGHFRRADDRLGFLVGHTLLRLAVAHHLGTDPAALVFDFTCDRCGGQDGRPRIIRAGAPSVSLSRTGDVVVVAVLAAQPGEGWRAPAAGSAGAGAGDSVEVGVDVERVSAVDFDGFDDVALSTLERSALRPDDLAARAALWVRKEAVAKALGTGFRRDPREIGVHAPGVVVPAAASAAALFGAASWLDVDLGVPGHAAAVAVASAMTPAAAATASPAASIVCTIIPSMPLLASARRQEADQPSGAGQPSSAASGLSSNPASSAATSA